MARANGFATALSFDMGGTSLPSGATVINAQPEGMATGKVGKKH